jgi:hypothetical protein
MSKQGMFGIPDDWEAYLGRLAWRRERQAGERGPIPYQPEPQDHRESLDVFCREQLVRVHDRWGEVERRLRLGPELMAGEVELGQLDFQKRGQ